MSKGVLPVLVVSLRKGETLLYYIEHTFIKQRKRKGVEYLDIEGVFTVDLKDAQKFRDVETAQHIADLFKGAKVEEI